MADNRNAVISIQADQKSALHLWLADTRSNVLSPLTTGTNNERFPSVSPDGRSILYSLTTERVDLTSVSVEDGTAKTLITTGHDEFDAAWSANRAKLAWVTNRRGLWEIWIRLPDGSDRPAVTAADFPSGVGNSDLSFNPSLSPDGERIIYIGPNPGTTGGGRCGSLRWRAEPRSSSPIPPKRMSGADHGHPTAASLSTSGLNGRRWQLRPAAMLPQRAEEGY